MDNPPGIYHTEDDEILTYKPTVYEKHAHKKLEHLLMHVWTIWNYEKKKRISYVINL